MEKKNMVLLTVIAVATLLVAVVGATFAYFTATSATDERTEGGKGTANIQTAVVNNTITMTETAGKAGQFTAENVYPGHKEVAELSVKVKTEQEGGATIDVPFVYDVTKNELGTNVKVRLYRKESEVKLVEGDGTNSNYFGCVVHIESKDTDDGKTHLFEKCEAKQETDFGTQVGKEVKLAGTETETVDIGVDRITVSDTEEHNYFYYVVIEYEDTNEDQDTQQGKKLEGTIKVA